MSNKMIIHFLWCEIKHNFKTVSFMGIDVKVNPSEPKWLQNLTKFIMGLIIISGVLGALLDIQDFLS